MYLPKKNINISISINNESMDVSAKKKHEYSTKNVSMDASTKKKT
jgi:hypothetical protein